MIKFTPFVDVDGKIRGARNIYFEVPQGKDCMGVKTWTYFAIDGWIRNLIANCLGIPETIEEE